MIDPCCSNLQINRATEIKSNCCTRTSCQSTKGRMALKAFLLQDSIDSSQLKEELKNTATPSTRRHNTTTSRSKAKTVNFDLSKNVIDHLPTTHSRKSNWYNKSDYISFRIENREYVRLATQNTDIFDHSQDPIFSSIVLSSSKQRFLRLYVESLSKKRNVAYSSRNVQVQTFLQEGWGESDLILRGLEAYILPDVNTYRKFYRKILIEHYNKMVGTNDINRYCSNESELRAMSIRMTEASVEFADILGCIDAVCSYGEANSQLPE